MGICKARHMHRSEHQDYYLGWYQDQRPAQRTAAIAPPAPPQAANPAPSTAAHCRHENVHGPPSPPPGLEIIPAISDTIAEPQLRELIQGMQHEIHGLRAQVIELWSALREVQEQIEWP